MEVHTNDFIFPIIGFILIFWWAKVILVDTIRHEASDETIGAGYILSLTIAIIFVIICHKFILAN